MGIFDFLKPHDPRYNHVITDDERMAGATTKNSRLELAKRKAELEMAKLELESERDRLRIETDVELLKQKLEDLQDLGTDDEPAGSSAEDMLLTTLLSRFVQGQQQPAPIIQPAPPVNAVQPQSEITDEQIQQIWNTQDKNVKKLIKALTDEQIRAELSRRMPTLTDSSLDRCVAYVRKAKI